MIMQIPNTLILSLRCTSTSIGHLNLQSNGLTSVSAMNTNNRCIYVYSINSLRKAVWYALQCEIASCDHEEAAEESSTKFQLNELS